MSKNHALHARQNPDFYTAQYRRLIRIALVQIIFIGAFIGWIFYDHFHIPNVEYFATTSTGQLIKIDPYDY